MAFTHIEPKAVRRAYTICPVTGDGSKANPLYWNDVMALDGPMTTVTLEATEYLADSFRVDAWLYFRLPGSTSVTFSSDFFVGDEATMSVYDDKDIQLGYSKANNYGEMGFTLTTPRAGNYYMHVVGRTYEEARLHMDTTPLAIDGYIRRTTDKLTLKGFDQHGRLLTAPTAMDAGIHKEMELYLTTSVWDGREGANLKMAGGFTNDPKFQELAGKAKDFRVAAGGRTYIFLLWNGELWIGGDLSNEGMFGSRKPAEFQQIMPDVKWDKLATGLYRDAKAAIDTEGHIWTWGGTVHGPRLGRQGELAPAKATGPGFKAVTISESTAMALDKDGYLWIWGNDGRVIGDGRSSSSNVPYPVKQGDTQYTAIAAGYQTAFAIDTEGYLWGWGYNQYGLISKDDINQWFYTPVKMGNKKWKKIAVMATYLLAIDAVGYLWARGENDFGQLGVGDDNDRTDFTQVNSWIWKDIQSPSVGLTANNRVYLWGLLLGTWQGHWHTEPQYSPVHYGLDINEVYSLGSAGAVWVLGRSTPRLHEPTKELEHPFGSILVSSDTDLNGIYRNRRGLRADEWVRTEGSNTYEIFKDGNTWKINKNNTTYMTGSNEDYPWEADWTAAIGDVAARVTALDWYYEDEPTPEIVITVPDGGLTVTIEGASARWSLDDGATWHNSNAMISLAPGNYTITFEDIEWHSVPRDRAVTIDSGSITEVSVTYKEWDYYDPRRWGMTFEPSEEPVLAAGRRVWYVRPGGSGNKSGSDWDNAMDNRASASNAAVSGDVIYVMEGTYNVTAQQTTKAGVDEYYGFSEEDSSWANRHPWEHRSIYDFSGGSGYFNCKALVDGAWAEGCSASYTFYGYSSTLTNCTAINNTSRYTFYGLSNSVLTNCTAINNISTRTFSVGSDAVLTSCTAINNASSYTFYGYSSTLTNCTAINNTSTYTFSGGSSTLTNCTAINNTSASYTFYSSSGTITNCTAINNTSRYTFYGYSSSPLTNCTSINCAANAPFCGSSTNRYTNNTVINFKPTGRPTVGAQIYNTIFHYDLSTNPVLAKHNWTNCASNLTPAAGSTLTNFIDLSNEPYPFHPYDTDNDIPPGVYMPGLPQTYESLMTIFHEILPKVTGSNVPSPKLLPNTILEGAGYYEDGFTPTHDADGTLRPTPPSIGAYEPSEPPVDPGQPTQGTLKVNIAGTNEGRWSIDNGNTWHPSGHSLNLDPDDYVVTYKPVAGYITPSNANTAVTADQTTTINTTYQEDIPEPTQGTLKVNITGTNEGRWSIDNGTTWYTDGHSINLSPGNYTVIFKDVDGYVTPSNENITITVNQTTTLNITYEEATGGSSVPGLRVSGTGSVKDGDYVYLSGEGNNRVWEKEYQSGNTHRIVYNEYEGWIIVDYVIMAGEWEYVSPDYYGRGTDPWTASWNSMWDGVTPTVIQIIDEGNGDPDDEPGETDPYTDIEVTGTDDGRFDGTYVYVSGEGDTRLWVLAKGSNAQCRIWKYDGEWTLDYWMWNDWDEEWMQGPEEYYFAANSSVDHPWEATGWYCNDMLTQMPTLTPAEGSED